MDPGELLSTYEEATKDAVARGAQLVVWPEGGLPFDPAERRTRRLQRLARETDAYIVAGYVVPTAIEARNEAVLIGPDGRYLGLYAKQHPISLLGERSDSDHGYPVFRTPIGTMAMLICYDVDYLDTPRTMVRGGAGILAVPSNDWPEISDVHYPNFVMRAIENRVSIVKADTAWDSAIVDPYGRVLQKQVDPDGARATLVASVPMGSGSSPAAAMGDLNGVVIALAAIGVLVALVVSARRRREDS